MRTRVVCRPIVFLRIHCSILILLLKTLRCSLRLLWHSFVVAYHIVFTTKVHLLRQSIFLRTCTDLFGRIHTYDIFTQMCSNFSGRHCMNFTGTLLNTDLFPFLRRISAHPVQKSINSRMYCFCSSVREE